MRPLERMTEYMRPFRETQATCRTLATIHVDDLPPGPTTSPRLRRVSLNQLGGVP